MNIKRTPLYSSLFLLLLGAGCVAPAEDKLGFVGEYCVVDTDCQGKESNQARDLICQQNVCVDTGAPISSEPCKRMCDRLVTECNRTEANCEGTCEETVKDWSETAVASFEDCIVKQLTCDQAKSPDAPSICYQRIPLPSARKQRCDLFINSAQDYDATSGQAAFDGLRDACYRLGRTADETGWSVSESCEKELSEATPQDFINCLNTVFSLNPQLQATVIVDG